jgi:hypothetical protein
MITIIGGGIGDSIGAVSSPRDFCDMRMNLRSAIVLNAMHCMQTSLMQSNSGALAYEQIFAELGVIHILAITTALLSSMQA